MSIADAEREKMLRVALCGPRVIRRLEGLGVRRLDELADRDPEELVLAVNHSVGAPIWRPPMATRAMTNLIAAAREARRVHDHGDADQADGGAGDVVAIGAEAVEAHGPRQRADDERAAPGVVPGDLRQ